LDTDNEVKMLQEYFKDVDNCVLEEDVKMHSTPRKEASASTRAPWLTPEEKPRGKVRPQEWVSPSARTQQKENVFSTPENKRVRVERVTPEKEMQLAKNLEKEVFATPEAKPRGRKRRAQQQTAQEHAGSTPVKVQAQAQRTYAGKLRRVR
jgi:hypothetical protein